RLRRRYAGNRLAGHRSNQRPGEIQLRRNGGIGRASRPSFAIGQRRRRCGTLLAKFHIFTVEKKAVLSWGQRSEHVSLKPIGTQYEYQRRMDLPSLLAQ